MAKGLADDAGDTVLDHAWRRVRRIGRSQRPGSRRRRCRSLAAASRGSYKIDSGQGAARKEPRNRGDQSQEIAGVRGFRFECAGPSRGHRKGSPRRNRLRGGGSPEAGRLCFAKQRKYFRVAGARAGPGPDAHFGDQPGSNYPHGPGHGKANRNPNESRQDSCPARRRTRSCSQKTSFLFRTARRKACSTAARKPPCRPLRASRFTGGEGMAPDDNDQNKMEVFTAARSSCGTAPRDTREHPPGDDGKAARPFGLVESHPKAPMDGSDRFFRAVRDRPGRIHLREARVSGQGAD